jgi:hypothetical protein
VSDVLEPGGEILLRLAGGRGLALERQAGGEYVGWAVYASADFKDGEPRRLRQATVAEALALAPDRRDAIVTATLDAIAVLHLAAEAGQPAAEVMPRQSERLVDELVAAGLARGMVLNLSHRLSQAHARAHDRRGPSARQTSANGDAGTMRIEGVAARLRRDLERANLGPRALAELLAGADASRDEIERHRRSVTRWLALEAHRGISAANAAKIAQLLRTDPARYLSPPRSGERPRLEQRVRDLEAKLRQTRDRLARLPPEYDARIESGEQVHAVTMHEPRRRWPSLLSRLVAAGALVLVAVVGVLIFGPTEGSRPKRHSASTLTSSSASVPSRRPPARLHPSAAQRTPLPTVPVSLSAIGAWDPYGDGREHDTAASAAEDGNSGTYWPTETYTDGLQKPGVGLLLDAGRAVLLRRLVLTTDTPGYSALIEAGSSAAGPFQAISRARTVATTTAFSLRARAERYYLIWISRLEHTAHVNEVRAFGY